MRRCSCTVRFGKIPRPSGTRHRPARARSSARAPLMRRPASTMLPDVARVQPGQHRQQRRLAGAVRARGPPPPSRRARRGRCRGAPRWGRSAARRPRTDRSGSLTASLRGRRPARLRPAGPTAGGPLARTRPRSSTWIWAHTSITSWMSCSTRTTATPSAATSRSTPAEARPSPPRPARWPARRGGAPWGRWPAPGPARRTRAWPVGSRSARWSARPSMPEAARGARRRPASGSGRRADVGGQAHVLPHGEQPEELEALERAGQALPGPLERRQLGDVDAVDRAPRRGWAAAGRRSR